MAATLIDGKTLALNFKNEMQNFIAEEIAQGKKRPGLEVILVGEDSASTIYVKNKREACEKVGIASSYQHFPATIDENTLIAHIQKSNKNPNIDGILLQLPLPKHMDTHKVIEHIDPKKDVDGFHPYNMGRLAERRPLLIPCTPLGIMLLLKEIEQPFKGKHAVIVGASNIVGRPMALLLLIAGATITVCHRFTYHLRDHVPSADILISAVGKPGLITGDLIKPGATVIDVGITRLADGSLKGDVDFNSAKEKAAFITPVPGGVGPMTVTMLLYNTLLAANYPMAKNNLLKNIY